MTTRCLYSIEQENKIEKRMNSNREERKVKERSIVEALIFRIELQIFSSSFFTPLFSSLTFFLSLIMSCVSSFVIVAK